MDDYREAILEWRDSPAAPEVASRVRAWLERYGLSVTTLGRGLLIAGPSDVFVAAFRARPPAAATAQGPTALPVPDELDDVVGAITVPPPPRPHEHGINNPW